MIEKAKEILGKLWGAGREQKIKAYEKNSALNIMRYFYR